MSFEGDEFESAPCPEGDHAPIAGMMHVHAEDLASVAATGRKVECNDCDAVYRAGTGWMLA